jgi:hypothetical protein
MYPAGGLGGVLPWAVKAPSEPQTRSGATRVRQGGAESWTRGNKCEHPVKVGTKLGVSRYESLRCVEALCRRRSGAR